MDLLSLPTLTVLSDNITVVEIEGIKVLRVIHDKATAGIALHGGHVISFQPNGQEDLIWMSDNAIFDGKAALRGGIPVCWPWFGRVAAPAHGFARTSEWSLIEHRENENGVIISLGLKANQQTLSIWPHQFDARLNIEVTDTLKVTLDVTNTDDHAWMFSGALHTYLNLGNIHEASTTGAGSEYIDSLQEDKVCHDEKPLVLTDTIDRVYTKPSPSIEVKDLKLQRTIQVQNEGHNSAVLWNPWAEGAAGMGDMTNDGYLRFLCVESTLHAPTINTGKTLQPNENHQLITILSIK
ncbi:D-hexose-6-phosphate mutarotase [Vibrio genomosp. F10]|uniref:Putative glucose-6-phosphate 1-epimerase n=2 Tax=Vibrio genomosp. F10 TaxID=723171 RepID=A0A1B9QYD5_9VIBR|nr:D-hexose-6-phosphate mutarotase [Vibrio genomosp. F10]OCH75260.1 D-hexose-6-phosphate mutarotase [Vibrio genomosp. F10]OEE33936.1 D-hexose-6-phosphate mutarotase [Vibrio genomosp. F10 str. ZF-129]OEE97686.1 D-hexose-6-phosphate mutarotase [Vibrio genomosp. F10 str. 9ZC157]OEF03994.1 D-hexose-6-phosphate mutarotase [Vibrio genomosp. F10 str. 9ZB36]OEF06792.1 D-hexose-6-phosphate mutarotase [Vibrio genomosp. F10 str. 9ZD137]